MWAGLGSGELVRFFLDEGLGGGLWYFGYEEVDIIRIEGSEATLHGKLDFCAL